MICYVFKVRKATFLSKSDNKSHSGYNVGLLSLEGAKFHLESFVDFKDSVFSSELSKKEFSVGFYDIDIDEFEVYTPKGSQYQKKIISIGSRLPLDENVSKLFFGGKQ